MEKGYLLLETGDRFEGTLLGHNSSITGEVVFNTSMTGYQEILTDPSYAGQIMTFCYPLIGNYGINAIDDESNGLHMAGVVISDLCMTPSHYLSVKSFAENLERAGIPCLAGVDTRAVVKKIRQAGTMKGIITTTPDIYETWIAQATLAPSLVDKVSTAQMQHYKGNGPHVVLMDYGFKKSILTALLDEGCSVTVAPYTTTYAELVELKPDGIVFSNGPGDPTALKEWLPEIKKMTETFPSLGICLGHQLIALAYGAKTDKLHFGHRGGNHPVKELETGKVWMTSQNHSYVVTDEGINQETFVVSYRNVNDQSVEGLKHKKLPVVTVQFHPEAHPGPTDTYHIFKQFLHTIKQSGETSYATTY
ncbi:carbamoyl-phosphate synthase small subunit [Pullulanibacillus pueri]|uniref:Carbamoyl phosphate synthase small chain n=1 Tax=Pullulanibacillus pueri TaxID=1437324 RepID=A0A8J2ZZ17_9BACL|nr:carbamoyl phosphate synthase small subunit [Pullulanibacillus pueri]MBM7683229.1 carbamoyl-phosphate synthase small subunit [Pullulanibacillus pueri]GGH85510.1 carbamoyl-phosphate synthase arginine-specific small chain [Pullulanibacillus pueri]